MSNIMGLDASVMPDLVLILLRNPEVMMHMSRDEIDEALELLVRADAIKARGNLDRQSDRHYTADTMAYGDIEALSDLGDWNGVIGE